MATPTGIIGFQGTIGGISFYMRKGKPCARKAGGPSKEKIATSKHCQRTRENNAEFKGAVAASKLLRIGLGSFTKSFSDGNLSWRLNSIFKKIIERVNGIRGERSVEILPNKDLLVGFNLNQEVLFDSIFQAQFSVVVNASRNEATIIIPDFDTTRLVNAAVGATHFRLISAITVVPKLVYDALAKQYFRADDMGGVLRADAFSDYISLDGMAGSEIVLNTLLPGSPMISGDSGLVCCIGIEFYQEVGGVKYILQSANGMKIVDVF